MILYWLEPNLDDFIFQELVAKLIHLLEKALFN